VLSVITIGQRIGTVYRQDRAAVAAAAPETGSPPAEPPSTGPADKPEQHG